MATFNEADASPTTGSGVGGDVRLLVLDEVSAAPSTGALGSTTVPKLHRDAVAGGYVRTQNGQR